MEWIPWLKPQAYRENPDREPECSGPHREALFLRFFSLDLYEARPLRHRFWAPSRAKRQGLRIRGHAPLILSGTHLPSNPWRAPLTWRFSPMFSTASPRKSPIFGRLSPQAYRLNPGSPHRFPHRLGWPWRALSLGRFSLSSGDGRGYGESAHSGSGMGGAGGVDEAARLFFDPPL